MNVVCACVGPGAAVRNEASSAIVMVIIIIMVMQVVVVGTVIAADESVGVDAVHGFGHDAIDSENHCCCSSSSSSAI